MPCIYSSAVGSVPEWEVQPTLVRIRVIVSDGLPAAAGAVTKLHDTVARAAAADSFVNVMTGRAARCEQIEHMCGNCTVTGTQTVASSAVR